MQMDELFEFVYILIEKKQVTAQEMAERFGVSSRTIYRWVEALSASGIPLYAVKGRGGGIAISERYALDKTVLTEEERQAIVASVKALRTLSGTAESAADTQNTAVEKLSHLSTQQTDWIEVDFAPWSPESQGVRECFGMLRDCILKKRQVAFDYFSVSGTHERRTVHPIKLVYRGQAWYLYGWCTARNSERFFKLTRMRKVQLTGRNADITKTLEGKSEGEKASYPKQKPPLLKIEAKVAPSKISYLLDTFICSQVIPQADGCVMASFTVPDVGWIYEMLLAFGPDIKIISPVEVRDRVIFLAEGVIKLYK